MITLAQKLSNHELLVFHHVATFVFRSNKKFNQYIELSKVCRMYKNCIDTKNQSCDSDITEKLLTFFCEISKIDCFCAMLYSCYGQNNHNNNNIEHKDEQNDGDNNKIVANNIHVDNNNNNNNNNNTKHKYNDDDGDNNEGYVNS